MLEVLRICLLLDWFYQFITTTAMTKSPMYLLYLALYYYQTIIKLQQYNTACVSASHFPFPPKFEKGRTECIFVRKLLSRITFPLPMKSLKTRLDRLKRDTSTPSTGPPFSLSFTANGDVVKAFLFPVESSQWLFLFSSPAWTEHGNVLVPINQGRWRDMGCLESIIEYKCMCIVR